MLNLELRTRSLSAKKANEAERKAELKKDNEPNLSPDREKLNLLGLDKNPQFSWGMNDEARKNIWQLGYQIQVVTEDGDEVWDSGKVKSNQSAHIKYPANAPSLESSQRYYWRVKVWYKDDEGNKESEWSDATWFEMGLLKPEDWKAEWITTPEDLTDSDKAVYFRNVFNSKEDIKSARINISSYGNYQIWVNGQLINDHLFAPGHRSYPNTQPYQTIDVARFLQKGENTIKVAVTPGWFKGRIGGGGIRNVYGTQLGLLAQIDVTYTDNTKETFSTDSSWQVSDGPILAADFRSGEIYDARLEQALEGDGDNWQPVVVSEQQDFSKLRSTAETYPVRPQREILNPKIIETPKREEPEDKKTKNKKPEDKKPEFEKVLDFGENIVGTIEFTVEATEGQVFKFTHGEALDKNGSFTIENFQSPELLPRASQEFIYIAKAGRQTVRPANFWGFRYVKVEGFEGKNLDSKNFKAVVVHSDLPRTGKFDSSSEPLNKYYELSERSLEGIVGKLPDCNTREEEWWDGDANVLAKAVAKLSDVFVTYRESVEDFRNEQRSDGFLYNNAPSAFLTTELDENGDRKFITDQLPAPIGEITLKIGRMIKKIDGIAQRIQSGSGWADAITMIPKALYEIYGDIEVLSENYEAMKLWVEYMDGRAHKTHLTEYLNPIQLILRKRLGRWQYILTHIFAWGEWLKPNENAAIGTIVNLFLPHPEVSTAYYYNSTKILAETAELLGKKDDHQKYAQQAAEIAKAYQEEFINKRTGRTKDDTQDSYVRALEFGLVPDELKPKAVARLVELIKKNGNHIDTGFLSSGYILQILAKNGHVDVAYDLLLQDTYPSWFFPMSKGATTSPEQWDSWGKTDEVVDPKFSLNHPAPTAGPLKFVTDTILGIEEVKPGYKEILIAPKPGGGLEYAEGELDTIYGLIVVQWRILENALFDSGKEFELDVKVPGNTTATITLPDEAGGEKHRVGSGAHSFSREWTPKDSQKAKAKKRS